MGKTNASYSVAISMFIRANVLIKLRVILNGLDKCVRQTLSIQLQYQWLIGWLIGCFVLWYIGSFNTKLYFKQFSLV